MKLNSTLVERTLDRFEAQAIPEDHPIMPQLSNAFGDHTFFIDGSGLHVVEPAEPSEPQPQAGKVIKLASWTDANRRSLAPHEPEATGVVIPFSAGNDPAA